MPDPQEPLTLRLFGSFQADRGGEPLPRARSRTEVQLLVLLALRRGAPVDRGYLAGLLWPDSTESAALHNLRRSLTNLRQVLGADAWRLITPSSRTIALNVSGMKVDVFEFDHRIAAQDAASLQQAVDLYRGPLFEECTADWLLPERESRAGEYLAVLERLARDSRARGDAAGAVRYLRLAVAADPLRESAHAALMEAHAAAGDYPSALQVYRDLRLLLHRELNAAPAAETSALFHRIQEQARRPAESTADPGRASLFPPPQPLGSLVGRDREVAAVASLLERARLVTLTGTGGVGKTRVAVQCALDARTAGLREVCWVELAPLQAGSQVPAAVAAALGVRAETGGEPERTLVAALQTRRLLLVLDNCEHMIDACAALVEVLLRRCAGLRVLTTSREALRISGEQVLIVDPLSFPDPDEGEGSPCDAAFLLRYDAVRLLLERAAERGATVDADPRQLRFAARICRRLDGLPLAIELAVARLPVLSMADLAAALERHLGALGLGSRTAQPRHQTLKGALAWSYDLLSEPERRLLRRLSVFVGGWTLEAAAAIWERTRKREAGRMAAPGLPVFQSPDLQHSVLDLLAALCDKSLVVAESSPDGERRFRLLETVREYCLEELRDAGEQELAERRHRDYFVRWAQAPGAPAESIRWYRLLEREYGNLRTALTHALRTGCDPGEALDAAGILGGFWLSRGYHGEGLAWWTEALERPGWIPPERRPWALNWAGHLCLQDGNLQRGYDLYQEAASLARQVGDEQELAASLSSLGCIARLREDFDLALSLFEEAYAISRRTRFTQCAASAALGMGWIAAARSELERARAHAEDGLCLFSSIGNQPGMAAALHLAGIVAGEHEGDVERGRALLERSLTISRQLGNRVGAAHALMDLAQFQPDRRQSRALIEESLTLRRSLGDRVGTAHSASELAFLLLAEGDTEKALPLLEESLAHRRVLDDRRGMARMLLYLVALQRDSGQPGAAQQLQDEALVLLQGVEDAWAATSALQELAFWELRRGNIEVAGFLVSEALRRAHGQRSERATLRAIAAMGLVCAAEAERDESAAARAVRLMTAAETLLQERGLTLPRELTGECSRQLARLRERLPSTVFSAAAAEGRRRSLSETVSEAQSPAPP